jgi:hypothetical protein
VEQTCCKPGGNPSPALAVPTLANENKRNIIVKNASLVRTVDLLILKAIQPIMVCSTFRANVESNGQYGFRDPVPDTFGDGRPTHRCAVTSTPSAKRCGRHATFKTCLSKTG